ncbi:MAG: hypothetical protein U0791_18920 [Gemmataceae bacterium]
MFAVVAGRCSAEEPADTRSYWVYEGGWFAQSKDGSWYEMNELTYRKQEKPSKFKESKRTNEYVELYDEKRKVAIQIYADYAAVRFEGPTAAWEKLCKGRWKTPGTP